LLLLSALTRAVVPSGSYGWTMLCILPIQRKRVLRTTLKINSNYFPRFISVTKIFCVYIYINWVWNIIYLLRRDAVWSGKISLTSKQETSRKKAETLLASSLTLNMEAVSCSDMSVE
jgi:hypothetical protein